MDLITERSQRLLSVRSWGLFNELNWNNCLDWVCYPLIRPRVAILTWETWFMCGFRVVLCFWLTIRRNVCECLDTEVFL